MKLLSIVGAGLLVCLAVQPLAAQTLRGSRTSVERIHRQAVQQGLEFHGNPTSVRKAVQAGDLVRLNGNASYEVEGASYPYLLPEAYTFVNRLSAQYRAACGEKLVVTSAVRPQTLRLANSSDRSVHPTGMAVDLRKPAKAKCLQWLRTTLLALEKRGVLEAVEEFRPPHFHVAVFPRQYAAYVRQQGGTARLASHTAAAQGGGITYQVRRGDTLWTIARRHGTSVEQIQQANRLNSSTIKAGQRLVIPATR